MATYAELKSLYSVEPVLALHISGLPYVWWSREPTWTVSGLTWRSGLAGTSDTLVESEIELLGEQIETPSTLTLKLNEDSQGTLVDLFALRKGTSEAAAGELITTSLAAGESPSLIEVSGWQTDAPTSGYLYLGAETISYTSKTFNTSPTRSSYGGTISRGRFHHLTPAFAEDTHIAEVSWDTLLQRPPMVSARPTVMRGRYMTLYRFFIDPSTGDVTTASEHEVLWRGRITMHSYVGDGYEVSGTSLTDDLDAEVLVDQPSAEISGYSFPSPYGQGTDSMDLTVEYIALDNFNIQCKHGRDAPQAGQPYPADAVREYSLDETANPSKVTDEPLFWGSNTFDIDLGTYDTVEKIIAALNSWFQTEYLMERIPAPMSAQISMGRVELVQEAMAVGLTSSTQSGTLAGAGYYETSAYTFARIDSSTSGSILLRPVTVLHAPIVNRILGLSDGEPVRLKGHLTDDQYETAAADIRDGTSTALTNKYEIFTAPKKPKRTWVRFGGSERGVYSIATAVDTGDDPWIAPTDGSQPLLMVDDVGLVKYKRYDTTTSELEVVAQAGDPVVRSDLTEPVEVEWDAPAEERAYVRQCWRPTYRHVEPAGVIVEGVHVLMLRIMTGTGDGAKYNSGYDILPADWSLGIPRDFVDVGSFEEIQDRLGDLELSRDYIFTDPFNFRDWLTEELRLLGYGIVMRQGLLTAVPIEPPSWDSTHLEIDDSVRLIDSQISHHTDDHEQTTQITLRHAHDPLSDDYKGLHAELSREEMSRRRKVEGIGIEIPGLRGWHPDPAKYDAIRGLLLDLMNRANAERTIYTCRCSRAAEGLTAGSVVLITDSRIPDQYRGTLGITEVAAIVQRATWDVYRGEIELTCVMYQGHDLESEKSDWTHQTRGVSQASPTLVGAASGTVLATTTADSRFASGTFVAMIDVATGARDYAKVASVSGSDVTFDRARTVDDSAEVVVAHADFEHLARAADAEDAPEFGTVRLGSDLGLMRNIIGSVTMRAGRLG